MQTPPQSAEDYWIQCIMTWYPRLHSQTYFLPPFHFNQVPYCVDRFAGEQVLVPQIPQDGPSHTLSNAQHACSRLCQHKYKTKSFPSRSNNSRRVNNSDVRDDKALQRVLHCLRALADNSQPKEVMMVISQLQFGKYLGEPSYAAAADLLPRPSTLSDILRKQHYDEGDFDVLIINKQRGLFTLEIKSVGENFSQLNMTEEQKDAAVLKRVKEAIKQLNKSEAVLNHLTSDLKPVINITKTIALPFITSSNLLRAIRRNPSDGEALRQCLSVHSVDDAVKLCLLSDQLSDVKENGLRFLRLWWQQTIRACDPQSLITSTEYEHLVARFCGPATTVEVHCVTAPRLAIRTLGEGVSETGERMATLVLFPQQVDLLNQSQPLTFLTGPPGTGKTVVLILQSLNWLHRGNDIHVVSTWDESRAATIAIEHQLQETTRTTTVTSFVHRHHFDLWKHREVKTAVSYLESVSKGRQLCVIADEAVYDYRQSFRNLCDQLIKQVPGMYVWGASVRHGFRPACLQEVKLTTPLRSPPVIVREVMEARNIKILKEIFNYTVSDVPDQTDGPSIIRITHPFNQSGHTGDYPLDCVECGHQVALVLAELDIGQLGHSNGPPPLQYRDVLVLCFGHPTDDRVDRNGHVTTMASDLVRGLRDCNLPVRVVETGDEAGIRDTALGVSDQVTVTWWRDVFGLERKVVVVEESSLHRLLAVSRCTSQLVVIDLR